MQSYYNETGTSCLSCLSEPILTDELIIEMVRKGEDEDDDAFNAFMMTMKVQTQMYRLRNQAQWK